MIPVRVIRKTLEAEDIFSFELVAEQGELPPFDAGSHIDVLTPGGLVRQYSLYGSPAEADCYKIAVLLEPASRGGSIAMHRSVRPGDLIQIGAPRNHFPLSGDAPDKPLLLAGGIGVTPILCMAERLAQLGVEFEMHYWTRSAGRTAFMKHILACDLALNVRFHFDDGPPEQKLGLGEVFVGPRSGRQAYICGPTGFLEAARAAARGSGWSDDQVHFEYFQAKPGLDAVTADQGEFEVQVAGTGAIYRVPPDKTVAQVLAENAVMVPLMCEQGVCGTCLTRVLSGVPEHRDLILTPKERARNDQFTPCCSRSKSPRLVLDL